MAVISPRMRDLGQRETLKWSCLLRLSLRSHTHDFCKILFLQVAIAQLSIQHGSGIYTGAWIPGSKAHQFSSVAQSCLTLCDPMDCSPPSFPVHHQPPEPIQTHVHQVCDATQPSHPLSSPSPTFNLSQHQGLFKWVSSSHQVAKVLEFQLQHQSFQWIVRVDFL